MTITEAVVLAGGIGSRLFPLTKYRPKPLVPIANYTMLDWNFHVLASNGITRVIVVVKYLGEQIKKHIEEYTAKIHSNMEIIIPDVDPKDTADAVRVVADYIKTDNFFVTMADIVTNINLQAMARFHLDRGGIATISLKSIINHPKQFGVILLDEKSKILHFLEKPTPQELYMTSLVFQKRDSINYHTNLINSGIYCFKRDLIDLLHDFKDLMDFGKNVFPFLLERKYGIFGFSEMEYFWQDCGRADQILWTNEDVLKRWNWPYLPKGIEKNGSWYGENIDIIGNVQIISPNAIGDNTKLKNNSKISLSSIGNNCVIDEGTEIKNSIIWDNTKIGKGVYIFKSIISDEVTIGDNCIIKEAIVAKNMIIKDDTILTKGEISE